MKITSFYLILVFVFTSCDLLLIPLKVESSEDKISITSLRISENIMVVSATRSFSALSSKSLEGLEENAIEALLIDKSISLFSGNEGTVEGETLDLIPGFIMANISQIESDNIITLTITDLSTDETATATTQKLPMVIPDSIIYKSNGDEYDPLLQITLTITDSDPETRDYFVAHVYSLNEELIFPFDPLDFFTSNDLLLKESIFTDEKQNEEGILKHTLKFRTTIPQDSLTVAISHIEEGYYRFLEAYKRNRGDMGLFSEPVTFPSNVENGFGYFSAHQPYFKIVIRE